VSGGEKTENGTSLNMILNYSLKVYLVIKKHKPSQTIDPHLLMDDVCEILSTVSINISYYVDDDHDPPQNLLQFQPHGRNLNPACIVLYAFKIYFHLSMDGLYEGSLLL
jgi:hypothetical protein